MQSSKYFIKVKNLPFQDLKLPLLDLTKLELSHRYGVMLNNEFHGITYYNLQNVYKDVLMDAIIKPNHQSKFKLYLMVINVEDALPHTDDNVFAVINYYIETGNATTHFWERDEKTMTAKLACQKNAQIYDEKTLMHRASFKAATNDIYILNVKKIHSVKLADQNSNSSIRIAFCFQTNEIPFAKVYKSLK